MTHEKADSPFLVPGGWSLEPSERKGTHLLRSPTGLMATVDFGKRCYRPGLSSFGRPVGPDSAVSGRGWKQALVDAAVAWLDGVERGEPGGGKP